MNLHLLLQVLHYLLILVPPDHHHDNHEEEHHGKRLLKVANDPRDKQGNDRQEPEEVFTLACGLSCSVALLCQGSLHTLLLSLWVKVGVCGGTFRGVNIPGRHRGEAGSNRYEGERKGREGGRKMGGKGGREGGKLEGKGREGESRRALKNRITRKTNKVDY